MIQQETSCRDEADGLSDEELAGRVQAGSSSCFAPLVRRHENRLLRFLYQRTGHRHDAEDLLQETFIRAFNKIESYDSTWKFTTWLFTIASRLACSHHRKRKQPLLIEAEQLPSPRAGDPARIVAESEQKDNLWALAARSLSSNQYTALSLRYGEDMSVKEIARVMGKTRTHVKVLLFRARAGLGRTLRPQLARNATAGAISPPRTTCVASPARGGG